MQGIWTLTAPDGRTWKAESPLRVVAMESRERVPATVALQRIMDAVDSEVLVPREPDDALLRPFYECPPEELRLAWNAMLYMAERRTRDQRPIQLQGATSPQGAMVDAEAREATLASSGSNGQAVFPDPLGDAALLREAAEALEDAFDHLPRRTANNCASVAARIRSALSDSGRTE